MTYQYQKELRDEGASIKESVEMAFLILEVFNDDISFRRYWEEGSSARRDLRFRQLVDLLTP